MADKQEYVDAITKRLADGSHEELRTILLMVERLIKRRESQD